MHILRGSFIISSLIKMFFKVSFLKFIILSLLKLNLIFIKSPKRGDCKCIKCPPLEVLEFDDKTVKGLMCLWVYTGEQSLMWCLTTNVDPSKCWGTLKKRRFSWRTYWRKILKKQDPEDSKSWRNRILKTRNPKETGSRRIEVMKKDAAYWRHVKMKIKLKRSLR